jgi:hypothetical protein
MRSHSISTTLALHFEPGFSSIFGNPASSQSRAAAFRFCSVQNRSRRTAKAEQSAVLDRAAFRLFED